ncbi:Zn(2)-Cys(6) zinc finger domain protein [Metarhizium robertsii]|uniref:Zn(2)-Cys(6) zinc finger domain protein n=1 Tax=Metarhizium robertsii TaxID=568076 RepID=A0A0A1UU57_9HYPO|nr:Zn(2)-Cys(6) zinc finger domain protein [Metarhizium robertsii]
MPYHGRRSGACHSCRIRKIKCDESRPACNQCTRSRRQCPGYHDRYDKRRDEKPVTKPITSAAKYQTPMPPDLRSVCKHLDDISLDQAVVSQPHLSAETIAPCYFHFNFIVTPHQRIIRGFNEYMALIAANRSQLPQFDHVFNACAMASLSQQAADGRYLRAKALESYTSALAATSTALWDPTQTLQDETLASVLLLALFENITAASSSLVAWYSHIEAAVRIVKARGSKQLRTKVGSDMFVAVRTFMIIHSLTTGSPLASGIAWCTADSTYDDYASQCEQFCVRTVELNAHVSELLASISRTPKDMDRVKDVIQQCHSLDQHFVRWTDAVPDEFRWETVDWQVYVPHDDYANADVFPGRVDVYADSWIAIVWTMARWSRIVLLSVLVRATAWLHLPKDYRSTQEYATAARLCTETITDVIASVPYQLGYVSNPHKSSTKTRQSGAKRGDSTVQRSMTAVLLAWALNGLQSQDHVTEAQRVWIKGRLNVIGTHLGIGYGTLLAKLNIRVPSMLIRRDRLLSKLHSLSPANTTTQDEPQAQPADGSSPSTNEDQSATQRQFLERRVTELLASAMGDKPEVDEWTVRILLQLPKDVGGT